MAAGTLCRAPRLYSRSRNCRTDGRRRRRPPPTAPSPRSDIVDQLSGRWRRGHFAELQDYTLARVIAALMAAGAVGNRPQPDLRPFEHGVLVALAHGAGMGSHGRPGAELV